MTLRTGPFVLRVFVALFTSLSLLPAALAQDYAREKRWADEVVPGVVVGDPLWLELPGGRKFLTLLADAPDSRAAVVLVHGVGVHPDHGVIGILRSKLNDLGYTTLSVQMPVAKSEGATVDDYYPALFPQAGERIAAAAQHLASKGHRNLVLVSHSMGAWMANVYLLEAEPVPFRAWIPMGLTGRFWGASLISIPWLDIEWGAGRLRLPILDIHGENDIPPTLAGRGARASALTHIPGSEQVMIPGADHHYAGKETELARVIDAFLKKTLR